MLFRKLTLLSVLFLFVPQFATGQEESVSEAAHTLKLSNFQLLAGFFDCYWDAESGKLWLRLDHVGEPFLYVTSLATGLGSNPVGLDRGQLGDSRIVRLRRVGSRVFLLQENTKYRATTNNATERRAIRDSFAESILWSGEVQTGQAGDGQPAVPVVDLTSLLLRDAHDCVAALASSGQGDFSLDTERSFIEMERTKAFPRNNEFEAALTFASTKPGPLARRVAADGQALTMKQHHSFVRLPEAGYRPRRFDPRVGCFDLTYADYSVPIDQPIERRFITRHRLEKKVPGPQPSEARRPIVYYIDPGVPQPIRDALLDGARWWAEAFEDAGFRNAFQVRVLPEDADPMDVRYNVIQWVHRATRGWSYGQSVIDPRTGEILKGHVLLGSLRVRQDHLLFQGLQAAPLVTAGDACGMVAPASEHLAAFAPGTTSTDLALARIRQLSAHEVGHTLGFAHNFAASTYGDRASVMDYPAPRTRIVDGRIDLSEAYGVGVGVWDRFTVKYAYSEFAEEEESQQLQLLVDEALAEGWRYLSDADARPAGAAHPLGNLWDNGSDPVAALEHELHVRRLALDRLGPQVLAEGQPVADLEQFFVPIYLHHRYQVEATAKMLGGSKYRYAVKGDGQVPLEAIPPQRQRAALQVLLQCLQPEQLVIPQRILEQLPPKATGSVTDRERFQSRTAPLFDPGTAIRSAAELTLGNLLQPQRASRLASLEDGQWGLSVVLDSLVANVFLVPLPVDRKEREARRIVEHVLVAQLMQLATSTSASEDARALAEARLRTLRDSMDMPSQEERSVSPMRRAHLSGLRREIERFLERPAPTSERPEPQTLPPGSPIGSGFGRH